MGLNGRQMGMRSIVEHALGELNLLAESLPAGRHIVTGDI